MCFVRIILLIILSANFSFAEARSGCCSWHGGVCGCQCCDGTPLSAKCAPYYPWCYQSKKTNNNSSNNTDTNQSNPYNKIYTQNNLPNTQVTQKIPQWKDISRWRILQRGMNKDSVRNILGEPTKINVYDSFEIWYYGYPSGGEVEFSRNSLLTSWREPLLKQDSPKLDLL